MRPPPGPLRVSVLRPPEQDDGDGDDDDAAASPLPPPPAADPAEEIARRASVASLQSLEPEPEDADHRRASCRLSGEQPLMNMAARRGTVEGRAVMTTYRLCFFPDSPLGRPTDVPLALVAKLERTRGGEVAIHCKDVRVERLAFLEDPQRAFDALATFAFPTQPRFLFAFAHSPPALHNGWLLYDARREWDRQGVLEPTAMGPSPWRVSDANAEFALCPTYPRLMVVPRAFTDTQLAAAAAFRSKGRIPMLSWRHPFNAASIWRSSQPKVGMGASNSEDERLVRCIVDGNAHGDDTMTIVDCRPKANAIANRATGHGYESAAKYSNVSVEFMGIANIHAVRDSAQRLTALCLAADTPAAWLAAVEETRWLHHVRQVLGAALSVAHGVVHRATSVLVHCSDGWDRTSQVTALSMLLLDPYYRTLDGFLVLIEKEWLSPGHRFHTRLGHARARADDQQSPVFLQFVECVWQLWRLYTPYFEFSDRLLLLLADEQYTCRFGTFLFDNERERAEAGVRQHTASLWDYVLGCRDAFVSPLFEPESQSAGALVPDASAVQRGVQLWAAYWLRHAQGSLPVEPVWATSAAHNQLPGDFDPPRAPDAVGRVLGEMQGRVARLQEEVDALKRRLALAPAQHRLSLLVGEAGGEGGLFSPSPSGGSSGGSSGGEAEASVRLSAEGAESLFA